MSYFSLSTYLNFLSLFSVALTWGPIDRFKNAIYIHKDLIFYLHRALNKLTQSANQQMHTFNFFYLLKLI